MYKANSHVKKVILKELVCVVALVGLTQLCRDIRWK